MEEMEKQKWPNPACAAQHGYGCFSALVPNLQAQAPLAAVILHRGSTIRWLASAWEPDVVPCSPTNALGALEKLLYLLVSQVLICKMGILDHPYPPGAV